MSAVDRILRNLVGSVNKLNKLAEKELVNSSAFTSAAARLNEKAEESLNESARAAAISHNISQLLEL